MEGRKLQLTGGSTYVVSLPKRWVTDAGLKAGDTVFLEPQVDGAVSIRAHPAEKPLARRRVFEEKGEERRDHLLRKLIGAYIAGFGYIEIRFKPEAGPFVRRVARDFSRMVIGPEVIEESRNSVVIQDLSDTAELSAARGCPPGPAGSGRRPRSGCGPTGSGRGSSLLDGGEAVQPRPYSRRGRSRFEGEGGAAQLSVDRQVVRADRRPRGAHRPHVPRLRRSGPGFEAPEGARRSPGVRHRDSGQGVLRPADGGRGFRERGGG